MTRPSAARVGLPVPDRWCVARSTAVGRTAVTLGAIHVSQVPESGWPISLPLAFQGAHRLSASQRWAEGKRQKVRVKSGKWVLNAFRHLKRGHLLPFTFQAPRAGASGNETRFASVRNPKSKIENPKSCVGPSAILTGPRTRPSDWGSNARFGPVEDRRNNRRHATFTCTLCVLQI